MARPDVYFIVLHIVPLKPLPSRDPLELLRLDGDIFIWLLEQRDGLILINRQVLVQILNSEVF